MGAALTLAVHKLESATADRPAQQNVNAHNLSAYRRFSLFLSLSDGVADIKRANAKGVERGVIKIEQSLRSGLGRGESGEIWAIP